MALTVGSVIAKFQSDVSDFKKGIADAKEGVSSFSATATSKFAAATDASQKFAGAFALGVTALAGAIGFGAKIAGDLEAARQGFVALLGSAEAADKVMNRIKKEAAATPFELTGLVAGAQALTAVTKNGEQAIDILLNVGKAIATSGKGQAELDRVILNLQQISATGQVTAMDIRQFQGAIPMFNDILKYSGLTTEKLQSSKNAAELLFKAFEKAGGAGGITAAGFTSQAGTFKQLVSNLKDNFTILGSEIVKQTGAFDLIKDALGRFNAVLGNQDEIIGKIKGLIEFLKQYGVIIAGVIIGALVPAFIAWATAMYGLVIALAPFMIAGAAIGALIWGIIKVVQNWGAITEWFVGVWDTALTALKDKATEIFELYIKPILDGIGQVFTALWVNIINPIIESIKAKLDDWAAKLTWVWENIISPILLLILAIWLRVLFEIYTYVSEKLQQIWETITSVLTAVWQFIEPWLTQLKAFIEEKFEALKTKVAEIWEKIKTNIIDPITKAKNDTTNSASELQQKLEGIFSRLLGKIQEIWQKVKDAIVQPFEDAKRKIEEIAQKIKEAAEKINPFHRESPSLVDNVRRGVEAIKDAYGDLGYSLNPPSLYGAGAAVGGTTVVVNLAGANITDPSIAEQYAELIGDQIIRKLARGTRV